MKYYPQDEALIRPAESVGRPNLVPFYLIKQPGTPLEALDLIENTIQELAGMQASCRVTQDYTPNISRLSSSAARSPEVSGAEGDVVFNGTGYFSPMNKTIGATSKNTAPIQTQEWLFSVI